MYRIGYTYFFLIPVAYSDSSISPEENLVNAPKVQEGLPDIWKVVRREAWDVDNNGGTEDLPDDWTLDSRDRQGDVFGGTSLSLPEYIYSAISIKEIRALPRRIAVPKVRPGSRTRICMIAGFGFILVLASSAWSGLAADSVELRQKESLMNQVEISLEAGRLAEARTLIDEAKYHGAETAVPFVLEARLGLAERDVSLARLSAKIGLQKSGTHEWEADLALSRVLGATGEKEMAADAAMRSFIKGAKVKYAAEIAETQLTVGRMEEAGRIVTYARKMAEVREEGYGYIQDRQR